MTTHDTAPSLWMKFPMSLRAVVSGLLIALVAANVWPLLLLKLSVPLAVIAEALFLALCVVGERWRSPTQDASRPRHGVSPPRAVIQAMARAYSPRSSSPRPFMPRLFCCSPSCPFQRRHSGGVMIFPLFFRRLSDGWRSWSPRDLRRDWFSWLHAAPDRTAPRRACCYFDLFAPFYGATSHQRLDDSRNGADCVWRRRTARASPAVLRVAHSRNDRPRLDGHWAVCLLVDRHRWKLYRTTDQ